MQYVGRPGGGVEGAVEGEEAISDDEEGEGERISWFGGRVVDVLRLRIRTVVRWEAESGVFIGARSYVHARNPDTLTSSNGIKQGMTRAG